MRVVLYIFPYSILFILFFLIVPHHSTTNIINKTCSTCAKQYPPNLSYDFCYASLSSLPISRVADLGGLGLITLELALDSASTTILNLSTILSKNDSTTKCDTCLKSCLEVYLDTSMILEDCIGEFVTGKKQDVVYLWVSEIIEATKMCEGEFKEKGDECPITKENYELSQLCGMVLCIIDLMNLGMNLFSRFSFN